MPTGRRRPTPPTAVLGLLLGLVLLCGAVLDGGLSTPSRVDLREPSRAQPAADRSAPRPSATREDGSQWDAASRLDRPDVPAPAVRPHPTALASAALAAAALLLAVGVPGGRPPAVRVARHRGPPVAT